MCSRFLSLACGVALVLCGCKRETREFNTPPAASAPVDSIQISKITPGGKVSPVVNNPEYQENAYAVSQGKQLFSQYNCAGCHFNGGGGMGVPLMDDVWIYGSDPGNVFASITEGRPNGMPTWGKKIPRQQIWQLVAYVRSMSSQVPSDVAPARNDHMHARAPEQQLKPEPPKQ